MLYSFTDPEGMEGWVGLVGWPIADTLLTKWSHVNHVGGLVVTLAMLLRFLNCRFIIIIIDQVKSRVSPPSKDRRPNHWAMPPSDDDDDDDDKWETTFVVQPSCCGSAVFVCSTVAGSSAGPATIARTRTQKKILDINGPVRIRRLQQR